MDTRLVRFFSALLLLFWGLSPGARPSEGEPAEKRPKVDSHGDPLPPLARLRLGTTSFQHGGEIVALAFAPDGQSIATVGRDGMLRVWNTASGKGLASFHAPDGVAVAFAENGKALVWCDVHGQLYRCDSGQRGEDCEELLAEAAERVRRRIEPHTWEAFWLTALEGLSGAAAAGNRGDRGER